MTQEPYNNIEHMKSIYSSFLKVLEDYKIYYAYSLLNFESAFLELLRLLKSIFSTSSTFSTKLNLPFYRFLPDFQYR